MKPLRCAWTTAAVALVVLEGGCVFRTVREQQRAIDRRCRISGSVRGPESAGSLVVLLARKDPRQEGRAAWSVADHFVLEGTGRWLFETTPGTYGLAAFQDANRDLVYQPGEPFLRVDADRLVTCTPGATLSDLELAIPAEGRPKLADGALDIAALQARSPVDQVNVTLGAVTAVGVVTTLDDPRFAEENAKKGLWRPLDFIIDAHPGVYLLEPYDPARVPVLFVHGISDTPARFRELAGALDRTRFQAWVYSYPSGASLTEVVDHLDRTVRQLRALRRFDRLVVVAHSMGGLVARGFVLRQQGPGGAKIPLLVTLSTPWGGHAAAAAGVEHAPAVVRSWYDVAPDSRYLRSLFYDDPDTKRVRRKLSARTEHHLVFGFRRKSSSLGDSSDETIALSSQLRPEAQEDATALYGFDDTHTGIVADPAVARLLNRLLARAAEQGAF